MPNKLNILIVEDELLIAEMLKETLLDLDCNVVGIAQNTDKTFEILNQKNTIDLIFLDINLSEKQSGFTIAEKINSEYQIPFLFLTSYSDSQTIQNAIKYNPQGYIIKPFSKPELLASLELFKIKNQNKFKTFEIKEGSLNIKIKHEDIFWVKSENNYIEIKTNTKLFVVRNSLDKFLEITNDSNFIKVHRSFVINLLHTKAVNKMFVIVNDEKIPVSRKHQEKLLLKFSN